jgi:hypothetical protein
MEVEIKYPDLEIRQTASKVGGQISDAKRVDRVGDRKMVDRNKKKSAVRHVFQFTWLNVPELSRNRNN